MELNVETLANGTRCVRLAGRLDMKGTMAVELKFTGHVAGAKQSIIIDVSQVEYLASIGMRMLLSNFKALKGISAKMVVLAPQPLVMETLTMAGLDGAFPIAQTLDEALELVK